MRAFGGVLCVALAAVLIAAFFSLDAPTVDVPSMVAESLDDTGVRHPITGVLLGFRALDTLLEIAVLLVAVFAVNAARAAPPSSPGSSPVASTLKRNAHAVDPIIAAALKVILPIMFLVAGYLLWAGSRMPGGAFQAGALLAAMAVALRLSGVLSPQIVAVTWWQPGSIIGLLAFTALGAAPLLWGDAFLRFPPPVAGLIVIAIETVLSVSIALCLASLFIAASTQTDVDAIRSDS